MKPKVLLVTAAACSVLVALLHVYIIVQGPWAYRYFGAGETLAKMAEQGSWLPALVTAGIALVFAAFAAYYLAAAGIGRKPPFFRTALVGIAGVYTLRGIMLFPALLVLPQVTPMEAWSSLVSLAIGLVHVAALWKFPLRQAAALR